MTEMMLENLITTQKLLAKTLTELKEVNKKISELHGIFQESSKMIKEKEIVKQLEPRSQLIDKFDELMEQNRTIARGLLLLEKKLRE